MLRTESLEYVACFEFIKLSKIKNFDQHLFTKFQWCLWSTAERNSMGRWATHVGWEPILKPSDIRTDQPVKYGAKISKARNQLGSTQRNLSFASATCLTWSTSSVETVNQYLQPLMLCCVEYLLPEFITILKRPLLPGESDVIFQYMSAQTRSNASGDIPGKLIDCLAIST